MRYVQLPQRDKETITFLSLLFLPYGFMLLRTPLLLLLLLLLFVLRPLLPLLELVLLFTTTLRVVVAGPTVVVVEPNAVVHEIAYGAFFYIVVVINL